MTAMLDDMMQRQKNESRIMRFFGMNQLAAQMVHGRIPAQIISVGKVRIIKKRVLSRPWRFILRKQRAFVQAAKEERVDLSDFSGKQFFEIQKPLFSPFQTPPGNTSCTPIRRRFRLVEQSRAPHGVSLKAQNIIFGIRHCPPNGVCSDVKPDIVRTNFVFFAFLLHFFSLLY